MRSGWLPASGEMYPQKAEAKASPPVLILQTMYHLYTCLLIEKNVSQTNDIVQGKSKQQPIATEKASGMISNPVQSAVSLSKLVFLKRQVQGASRLSGSGAKSMQGSSSGHLHRSSP